ncbi:MAG TPA: DEAD/DEAH box helicase [Candidatus Limnocylindrales bacterium]|nr:DEAD/DEAH box helicase [Candidatus Limnocylindrales bacterium]
MNLYISPHGRLFAEAASDDEQASSKESLSKRVRRAFANGSPWGLLHLATVELQTSLPADLAFARDFGQTYLTRLCHTPEIAGQTEFPPVPPLGDGEMAAMVLGAPPMRGLEYLTPSVLVSWWTELDRLVRQEVHDSGRGVQEYLRERNPLWWMVGRVSFHLAENRRDPDHPFAFLATYASRLSAQGRVQHLPLGRALEEYAGARNRPAMLSLLQPIHRAAERSAWVKQLVDAGDVYNPLAWTPGDAYRMLQDIPALEESGLIVRVPDWWKAARPPRPVVNVKVGDRAKIGTDALLDFSVGVTLDGEPLDEQEVRAILESSGGLVPLKGKWVEVDRDKLAEALQHWKSVERAAQGGGITFFEGMRMLSGANMPGDAAAAVPEADKEWVGISAGRQMQQILEELRHSQESRDSAPPGLLTELRPYQRTGVHWLRFMSRLGLGACLADDMGLGKTIQVIGLLLHLRRDRTVPDRPSLLVVPASLIANWKSELARFAPSLSVAVAHPSEMNGAGSGDEGTPDRDLLITTYTMLGRLEFLREREWKLVILDEAQAIKNSGSRQTRVVKELRADCRIALTGTPVENRLSDLWSLFDFLNPGLLGGAKAFASFVKQMNARQSNPYAPLRTLVQPYILRRLKTDKRVISDLPEKTEINAFCGLSKRQAALYLQTVRELASQIDRTDGIQRRGIVLSSLMRLKQICNHPSQLTGDNGYEPEHSGKFQRLAEICQELADRQEKVLVFSQFREIIGPLADFLSGVFGRPGVVLHGQTAVGKRRELVEAFQRDDGPPFFVLSLRAGGTGLNLTSASHVIHFDRWWNPSVENQATDRAFRIGQKRNVLVHKFVCRGTVEDKIDELLAQKAGLSRDLLDAGGETLLTEMNDDQLLRFVALDINKAMES